MKMQGGIDTSVHGYIHTDIREDDNFVLLALHGDAGVSGKGDTQDEFSLSFHLC